jgi:hypothetical protein
MKLPAFSKQAVIITGAIVIGGAVAGVSALTSSQPTSASGTTPIEQQVDKNTSELANHDARITNNENDIKDLQSNTGTPVSTNNVAVPSSTPTPQVAIPAVTVTAFEQVPLDAINIDCKYTYSDGTTYQWHWQATNPHGSWVTDSFGNNGHWVASTSTTGACDQSAIGQAKP